MRGERSHLAPAIIPERARDRAIKKAGSLVPTHNAPIGLARSRGAKVSHRVPEWQLRKSVGGWVQQAMAAALTRAHVLTAERCCSQAFPVSRQCLLARATANTGLYRRPSLSQWGDRANCFSAGGQDGGQPSRAAPNRWPNCCAGIDRCAPISRRGPSPDRQHVDPTDRPHGRWPHVVGRWLRRPRTGDRPRV